MAGRAQPPVHRPAPADAPHLPTQPLLGGPPVAVATGLLLLLPLPPGCRAAAALCRS